jgi:hypothetical protein
MQPLPKGRLMFLQQPLLPACHAHQKAAAMNCWNEQHSHSHTKLIFPPQVPFQRVAWAST